MRRGVSGRASMIVFGAGRVAVVMAVVMLVVVAVLVIVSMAVAVIVPMIVSMLVPVVMTADFQHVVAVVMAMVVAAIGAVDVPWLPMGGIVRRVRVMSAAMVVVIMAAVVIGAALRPERPRHPGNGASLAPDHLGKNVIILDIERVRRDFRGGVTVADVPGDPHQAQRVLGPDFQQRFGGGMNSDKAAILEFQRVALGKNRRLVEIEQEFDARHGLEHCTAALTVLVGEHDRAGDLVGLDGGFADDCGGALHVGVP